MINNKGMPVTAGGTAAVSRQASKCRRVSKVRELQALKYSDGFVADQQLTENRREKRKMEALMSRLYDTQLTEIRRKRCSNEEMSDFALKDSQSPVMTPSNSGNDTTEKQEQSGLSATVKREPLNDDAFSAKPTVTPWAARDQKQERPTLHALRTRRSVQTEQQPSNSMGNSSKKTYTTASSKRRCSTRRASHFGLLSNASGEATLRPYNAELHSPVRQRSTVVPSCESLGEFLDAELNDDELIEMEPSCNELQWQATRSGSANPVSTASHSNAFTLQSESGSGSGSGSQMRMTRERSRRETRRQGVRSTSKKEASRVRKRRLDSLSTNCNRVRRPQLGRKTAHDTHVRKRSENVNVSQRALLQESAAERTEREERSNQRQAARLACTLYEAVKSGNVHLVRQTLHLVANRPDATRIVDALNIDGFSPLHRAVINGSTNIVRELLKHGAECDVPSRTGSMPLDEAVRRASAGCIRLLVLAGANRFAVTHESCEVTTDGKVQNAFDFASTLVHALDQSDQAPSINKQLRTVCALSKHEPLVEEMKRIDSQVVELEFSDRPLDDVIVLRESTAAAERLYVLADHLERPDEPLDNSFIKRHETVASLSTQFEFVAPFFDVHRAAHVYDSLALRSADFCTADELVDDDIANLADYNDVLRQRLSIRTRVVSLRSCDHSLLRPHLPVNYNALVDHDYTCVKRSTPVMIREKSLTSPVSQPLKGTRQRRTRKATKASFDSNANTTRSALSDIHLMPVTDDIRRPTFHTINTLSEIYMHPSGAQRRLAYHQRLIMPASVTIVENGLPTEKQGVLMFIPFAQQQCDKDPPAETGEMDSAVSVSPAATCPDLSLSSVANETETEVSCTALPVQLEDTTDGAPPPPPPVAKRNEEDDSDPLTQRVGTFLRSLCNRVDLDKTDASQAPEQTTQFIVPFGAQRKCVSEILCATKAKRRSESTLSESILAQDGGVKQTTDDEAPKLVTPEPEETNANGTMEDPPETEHVSKEPVASKPSEVAEAPANSQDCTEQPISMEQCSDELQQTVESESVKDLNLTGSKPEQHEMATIWSGFEMAAVGSTSPACEQPSSSLNEHDSLPAEGQPASWCSDGNADMDTNLFALAQKWAFSGS